LRDNLTGSRCAPFRGTRTNNEPETQLTGELPNLLMTLSEGGVAKYFAPNAVAKVSWNDSCVTSKVSTFGCQSQTWTNGYNCALSCDICSCDSNLTAVSNEGSSWQRTASTLTLAPWGKDISFDYCLKDNVLQLSSEGMFLAYEPVNTLSAPKPCAGRSAAECITGEGCSLGACVGGAACEQVGSEGSCLTLKGCSWNAQQCQGRGQVGCSLADFGKVPGCEFVDKPLICTGNQPACSTRSLASCAGTGCKLNETGRCSGPALPCEDFFACPDGYCQFENSVCSGVTSCSAYKSKEQCGYPNSNLPEPRCQWEASWCEGEPLPCERFSQQECASNEGCQLTPAP